MGSRVGEILLLAYLPVDASGHAVLLACRMGRHAAVAGGHRMESVAATGTGLMQRAV